MDLRDLKRKNKRKKLHSWDLGQFVSVEMFVTITTFLVEMISLSLFELAAQSLVSEVLNSRSF